MSKGDLLGLIYLFFASSVLIYTISNNLSLINDKNFIDQYLFSCHLSAIIIWAWSLISIKSLAKYLDLWNM